MPVYSVIDKATQVEITRYAAATIHETLNGVAYPQADYDHIEYVEPAVDAPPPAPVILTKREFIKRFTVAEYATIKTAAASNATLDYYWQMFMLAENIDTTDPDTIAGVTMLEQAGLIAAGRAQEILNG